MYRIHGHVPQEFPVTFETAVAQVNTEDAARIRSNADAALRRADDHDLPNIEYRITRPDGAERVLLGTAKVCVGPNREPLRMVGTVQDVTEARRAEREHRIAETLQRGLLPDRLPEVPGMGLAARYVPASADMAVGGDRYDVVELPSGHIGLAIGDVAGHGPRAASTMGQLRMALRAYALEEPSPAEVVSRLDRLVSRLLVSEIVTLIYLVLDLDSGMVKFANAGHPPPLVVGLGGQASFLEEGLDPRWGATIPDSPRRPASGLSPIRPSCSTPTGWWRSAASRSMRVSSASRPWRRMAARTSRRSASSFCAPWWRATPLTMSPSLPSGRSPLQVAHSYVCPQNRVCSRRCARPCVAGFGRATPTHTSRMTSSSPAVRCART